MVIISRASTEKLHGRWLGWCFSQGPEGIRLTGTEMVDHCTYVDKIFEALLGIVQLLICCLSCRISKSLGGAIVSMMQTPGFSRIR